MSTQLPGDLTTWARGLMAAVAVRAIRDGEDAMLLDPDGGAGLLEALGIPARRLRDVARAEALAEYRERHAADVEARREYARRAARRKWALMRAGQRHKEREAA